MNRLTAAFRCFVVMMVVAMLCGPAASLRAFQASTYMMAEVSTVPTPDFKGLTLEQVRAKETLPAKVKGQPATLIFRNISTQGPADGVVASQSPAANVPVYPGRGNLSLTFEAPKQSAVGKVIAQIFAPRPQATVPPLTGDTCEAATTELVRQRLRAACTGDMSGVVVQQYPPARTSVAIGSVVNVTLQVPLVVVPSITGLTLASAADTLGERRLHLGVIRGAAKGVDPLPIDSQSPAAGTSVPVNTAVDVTLQIPQAPPPPPPMIVVPYLERLSKTAAANILTSVGLTLGTVTGPEAGVVKGQSPATGTQVAQGAAVDLTLEVPVVQVEVPDMVGQSLAVAESRLGILKLHDEARFPQSEGNRATMLVESQDPAPETMVQTGTSVVLNMGGSTPPPPLWKWIGLGVAGALGVGLSTWAIRRLLVPHTVVTTYAHTNPAKAKITCTKPPGIKFTITLRDEPAGATYRADHEPEVLQKGGKR